MQRAVAATASRKKRKHKASCRTLERKARRIKNKRKRKAALRKLPRRCKKPAVVKKPPATVVAPSAGTQPAATLIAPAPAGVPGPVPAPPTVPAAPASPIAVFGGTFDRRAAERLLWRAGFGPRPGQAEALAQLGLEAAVHSLTRPEGDAGMDGPEPTVGGQPIDPYGTWGHDHLWWLDRMVRSEHQLVERLALVFHDWFATSNDAVGSVEFMIEQSNVFRAYGLGSFHELTRQITTNRAMLVFLSGIDNRKGAINENYGREVMELFCLGADRGAYTETDVRELARALSGWRADWQAGAGFVNFRFDPNRWDPGAKTVFGHTGTWGWEDGVRLVIEHPLHASFFVGKLWSYFIPTPVPDDVSAALQKAYVDSGHLVRPVLEAILMAPQLYEGPAMVKPPAVFSAGLLRATGQGITSGNWSWMGAGAGQQLFRPPDVSGWDDTRWLDTNTMRGRWDLVNQALEGHTIDASSSAYAETPAGALANARAFWNDPRLSAEAVAALTQWTANALPISGGYAYQRAQRQNALRMLIGMSPDHHVS